MTPYKDQPKVDMLYSLFSHQQYKATQSYVLPSGKFEIDPLFQSTKQEFVVQYVQEEKPFILSGPEYN
jgi:hypothetical protein